MAARNGSFSSREERRNVGREKPEDEQEDNFLQGLKPKSRMAFTWELKLPPPEEWLACGLAAANLKVAATRSRQGGYRKVCMLPEGR